MKKWLTILVVSLFFAVTGGHAEENLSEQPVALDNSAGANTEQTSEVRANDSIAQIEIQNLQLKVEVMQNKLFQLQKRMLQLHYLTMGLLGSVILMALLLLMLQKRKKRPLDSIVAPLSPVAEGLEKTIKLEDDTRGEYDFMGSSEGIPAKLDLARAYIAMEDFDSARQTLSEILGEGDDTQCQEARALLKKINPQ